MQIQVTASDANNIICEVTPPAAQLITIDRGVVGNGIASIVPVTISTFQYLRITYTDGTVVDVGPLTSTAYTATAPIDITGNTISLLTVPIATGGTGATTAAAAIQNLLPSYTANGNKRLGLNAGATALEWVADGGGTVTSVAVSGGTTGLTTSGGPITGSGTITLAGTLAVANGGTGVTTSTGTGSVVLSTSPTLVTPALGTPTSGNFSTGTFTWPTFNQNTTGTAAGLSATLAITSGGTGATTANDAFNALAPSQTGNSGKYLTTDGINTSWATNPLGTVTSVQASGGTTGLSFTGGPITTSGTLTLSGTLAVANGGTGITAFGTGVATALGINVGSAGAFVVNGGALGTPSSGTLTNATGLPVATGISGLGTGVATALAVNIGSAGAPVLFNGALGTPSSGTVTNLTGTASININGTVGATTASTGAFTTLTTSSTVTLSGGTANGVAYLNGSKVLTTGSALTFDGTTLGNTGVFRKTNAAVGIETAYWGVVQNAVGANNGTAFTLGVDTTTNYGQFQIAFDNLLNGTGSSMRWLLNNGSATAEKMRLDSSGNLGLGVTPSAWGSVWKPMQIGSGAAFFGQTNSASAVHVSGNTYYDSSNQARYIASTFAQRYRGNDGAHEWYTAPSGTAGNAISFTQAMTLDASGNLLVGTTSNLASGARLNVNYAFSNDGAAWKSDSTSTHNAIVFKNPNGTVGTIQTSGVNTLYNITSDQRLKTNIVDAPEGNIDAIKVRSFNWVADGTHQIYGVVAQELLEVAPYAVSQPTKSDEMMGVDYSKLVPMLVKEIQSLRKRLTALEGK